TAFGLLKEALSFLGSPDSDWRDDIGYGVVASCVYQKRALEPEERRALVAALSANLRRGIGETGTDSVLQRSFSALDLSILAALENLDPVLDERGYRELLDAALAYLRDERDLRGFDPRVGWIHATAHTADLLKFLARDARFAKADQRWLFDAAWSKMTNESTAVFTHAEDERLAAALASVVRRADFDPSLLDPWLARFVAQEKQLWSQAPPRPQALDAAQNARNLLRGLFVELHLPAPAPPGAPAAAAGPAQAAAREKLLATLRAIRR
ncbi:MAG: DUF2785 domain-containing protein, partial [Betaproteobacteria bacterium]